MAGNGTWQSPVNRGALGAGGRWYEVKTLTVDGDDARIEMLGDKARGWAG